MIRSYPIRSLPRPRQLGGEPRSSTKFDNSSNKPFSFFFRQLLSKRRDGGFERFHLFSGLCPIPSLQGSPGAPEVVLHRFRHLRRSQGRNSPCMR